LGEEALARSLYTELLKLEGRAPGELRREITRISAHDRELVRENGKFSNPLYLIFHMFDQRLLLLLEILVRQNEQLRQQHVGFLPVIEKIVEYISEAFLDVMNIGSRISKREALCLHIRLGIAKGFDFGDRKYPGLCEQVPGKNRLCPAELGSSHIQRIHLVCSRGDSKDRMFVIRPVYHSTMDNSSHTEVRIFDPNGHFFDLGVRA